jgi:alanine-glyoxylate transaminase/serine-glyoxylate transaminase/serine-pyruvate transaminase
MGQYSELNIQGRILLGPGPSIVPPRVLHALSHPLVGHLDPQFLELMNEVQELLRYVFQTDNPLTIPVSGTGSAGMEAALCNLIEEGDSVLVCVNGYFSTRMVQIAKRYTQRVHRLDRAWGTVFTPEDLDRALSEHPAKIVALVHIETSTGTRQPMEGISEVVHRHGALLILDCVASLGGEPVYVDEWDVDLAHGATQKCLSCPPGLAPLTVGPRAMEAIRNRKTPVANWYLDLSGIEHYWGKERTYHHTAPISLNYALREALRLIYIEGLDACFARHRANAEMLWQGLEDMGLQLVVPEEIRPPPLTTVWIPQGVQDLPIRTALQERYNVTIAGGLGDFQGRVWRIGLMGNSSRPQNVLVLLGALQRLIVESRGH